MARTKKADFQLLADKRMREAKVLLAAGEADGAYYLGGYAIECGIKACIIKKLNTSDEWLDRKFSDECYKHGLDGLLKLADLEEAIKSDAVMYRKWGLVKDWKETTRYEHGKTDAEVMVFLDAMDDPVQGVLTWIKSRW